MAQRGTGYAKRSGATEAIVADAVMRSMEDDDAAPRPVALDLAPLIAPYRKHGRLSLRVERLPPRGRLTRGHNNGDRSWSLMSDELDGLAYLPPKGAAEFCTLGIRIVSLDGGDGGTLALIDYPVSSTGTAVPPPAVTQKQAASKARVAGDDGELARLRAELADAKAALAEREAEIVAARGRFERELQDQLAASSKLAADMLERERAQTRAGHAAKDAAKDDAAKADARTVKLLAEAEARAARAVADADARAVKLLAEAEARAAKALAETEATAAEALAEIQAQLDRARTRGAAESARERGDEAERKRLRDEVQRLKKALAAQEEELVRSRETWQRDSASKLAKAEGAWRDRESRELADARAQWQERSERALSEAKAQFERAQGRAENEAAGRVRELEAEVERLRDAIACVNSAIADREGDIADIQARLDAQTARADTLGAHEDEIRRLESQIGRLESEVAEGERGLAKAGAQMEQATADARARLEQTRRDAQTALDQSRRDAGQVLEQAKADWRATSDAALAAKLAESKREETQRLQTLEAEIQNQSQVQLARNAKRIKELEAERDQFRAHAEALLKRGDSDDIKQLRRDFGHLQALLATREQEIAQLTLDSEHARERWTAEARLTMQKAEHEWKAEAEAAEREERKALSARRTIRDVTLVGAVSALAVMFYLYGSPMDWIAPTAPPAAVAAATARPAAAASAHMVTVLKSANVRSGPSKTADIVATLPKATALASLERHGNWVRVKLSGAKASEGWIYATYLADAPPARP
ncbi:MAG: SH3 domain-containing protein [Alphaproteobacteria bacterium]|nr:SH3 domain-containing protein [Alphaproteobacteria bacterium]